MIDVSPRRQRMVVLVVALWIAIVVLFAITDFVTALTMVAIVIGPLSIGACAFLWTVYGVDRRDDPTRGWLRLSLVMAVSSTISTVVANYIAIILIARLSGYDTTGLAPITALAFLALDVVPLMSASYLMWLRRNWTAAPRRRHDDDVRAGPDT